MLKYYANTNVGKQREKNEDYFKVGTYEGYNVYIVADGMGGYHGGEIASKLATEETFENILKAIDKGLINSPNGIGLTIIDAIKRANNKVYEYSRKDENLKNMGTTIIVAIEKDNKLYYASLGDSRIYKYTKKLEQITIDDTYVFALLKDGIITEEEAKVHPQRHVLTKALGIGKKIELSYNEVDIKEGDVILMCTDGITNMISNPKIEEILVKNKDTDLNVADTLIKEANSNGGTDNSTAVVIYM